MYLCRYHGCANTNTANRPLGANFTIIFHMSRLAEQGRESSTVRLAQYTRTVKYTKRHFTPSDMYFHKHKALNGNKKGTQVTGQSLLQAQATTNIRPAYTHSQARQAKRDAGNHHTSQVHRTILHHRSSDLGERRTNVSWCVGVRQQERPA